MYCSCPKLTNLQNKTGNISIVQIIHVQHVEKVGTISEIACQSSEWQALTAKTFFHGVTELQVCSFRIKTYMYDPRTLRSWCIKGTAELTLDFFWYTMLWVILDHSVLMNLDHLKGTHLKKLSLAWKLTATMYMHRCKYAVHVNVPVLW